MVVTIGDDTVMGRIAGLAEGIKCEETPLSRDLTYFTRVMTWLSFAVGALFAVVALINGFHWLDALIFLIGILVANVPEGLLESISRTSVYAEDFSDKFLSPNFGQSSIQIE
jgi:sodium/potassium-transporting ATPase subunit alpha